MYHLLASGPHLAVIPTLTALAVRHFKHKQGQDDGGAELEPKHPAVKFLLGAWNEGDFSEADKHIAPDIEIYTNGLSLSPEHGGPAMAKESIESWRALAPDLRMELSQEIGVGHRIVIEFRINRATTRGHPCICPASGGAIDVEDPALPTLSGAKVTEVRTVFDSLALAVQTGPEAPAGGPGAASAGAVCVRLLTGRNGHARPGPGLAWITSRRTSHAFPSLPARVRAASRHPAREPRPADRPRRPPRPAATAPRPRSLPVLVTPGEDEELAAVLRRLYDSPAERAALADRALRRVRERFAWPPWRGPPPGSTWPRWKGLLLTQGKRTGRVPTVDFRRSPVRPGHRVLDLGCGGGRHAFEAFRCGANAVTFDLDPAELTPVTGMFGAMQAAGEAGPEADATAISGTRPPCRSATGCSTG